MCVLIAKVKEKSFLNSMDCTNALFTLVSSYLVSQRSLSFNYSLMFAFQEQANMTLCCY